MIIRNFPKASVYFSLVSLSVLALCSCSSEDIDLDSLVEETNSRVINANQNTVAESSSAASSSAESQQATVTNEIVRSTQFFGQNGNLYKPVSDADSIGAGNLVVLFSSSFTRQFESCDIVAADGTRRGLTCIDDQPFTQIPFSCFSNGNRQTWRANFRCEDVGAILVTCLDFNQEITFTVPDGQQGSVCSRFG